MSTAVTELTTPFISAMLAVQRFSAAAETGDADAIECLVESDLACTASVESLVERIEIMGALSDRAKLAATALRTRAALLEDGVTALKSRLVDTLTAMDLSEAEGMTRKIRVQSNGGVEVMRLSLPLGTLKNVLTPEDAALVPDDLKVTKIVTVLKLDQVRAKAVYGDLGWAQVEPRGKHLRIESL